MTRKISAYAWYEHGHGEQPGLLPTATIVMAWR